MALARFNWTGKRATGTQARRANAMAPSADACGASATALAADARGASEGGFSLVETIIASGVMITAVVGLAQLFVMSTRTNVAAKSTSITAVLAQQKMEQLRSLEWGFDALGLPNTDTTTNTANVPMTNNGTGLSPSPVQSSGGVATTTL